MQGYGQFCPVAKTLELIGGRWTGLIIRELLLGSCRFNDLQRGVPLMSKTLLIQRLRELEDACLVASVSKARGRGREYRLTEAGEALRPIVENMSQWGQVHAQNRLGPEDYDPSLLLWSIRRQVNPETLAAGRCVIRFELRNVRRSRRRLDTWWLVIDRSDIDICSQNPGFEVTVVVNADIAALTRVWLGYLGLTEATGDGRIRIEGAPADRRTVIDMLDLRPMSCVKQFSFSPPAHLALETLPAA
jgi:DNA-binding HxlR family transcriptional regulator